MSTGTLGMALGTALAVGWPSAASAVVISFTESGGTINDIESIETTTTTTDVTGLPGCGVAPCVMAKPNGKETGASVDLSLPANTFTQDPTGATLTALGYVLDRDGSTISDRVTLRVTPVAGGLQRVSLEFASDSPDGPLGSVPGGFNFTAIEGMPTTETPIDISSKFFTGPAGNVLQQMPYGLPGGYMVTVFSDTEIPEPPSFALLSGAIAVLGMAIVGCRGKSAR